PHLARVGDGVGVAALAAGGEAQQLAALLGEQHRDGGVGEQRVPALRVERRELVTAREQRPERRARGLVPYARPPGLVARRGAPDSQGQPPAIAGRITTVSPSDTLVSRPSSTRTSSSFR